MHDGIRERTGYEPVTCPWRVYDDPVIQAARAMQSRIDAGVVDIDRQLAVVVEAAEFLSGTTSHLASLAARERREDRERQERQRAVEERARNGG